MTPTGVLSGNVFRPSASTADRSYHHALMLTFVLVVVVWVLLPIVVYRMVNCVFR